MNARKIPFEMRVIALGLAALVGLAASVAAATTTTPAPANDHERLRIPVGHGEVISSTDDVRTVAIAEPKIADAAVGSQKTVVVNGKSAGTTTLVVYNEGARFKVYDIEVYVPGSERQIAVHSTLAELSEDARHQLGFDWEGGFTTTTPWIDGGVTGGLFPTKTSPGERDGVLSYVRTKGDLFFTTQWEALKQNGDLRELANPTVVARSGEKASFLAGGEIPVPIATGGGAGVAGSLAQTVTIEWKEFGVRLDFTPTLMDDGRILLDIATEVSALDFTNAVKLSGFELPALVVRKAHTVVMLKPNEYLVLSGLKQSESVRSVRKVPIIGEIPLLGTFFKSNRTSKVDKDLLVVVSPEMVEPTSKMPSLPTDAPMPSEPGKK